jgi:predicted MFS family arabinose efflux permease
MIAAHSPGVGYRYAPAVVVACGCLIAILVFGPRTTMGLLLPPMNRDTGWTRDVLAFAIAVQHIVWGVAQPFGGAIADRLGTVRALCAGAALYSAGLVVMASATTPAVLYLAGALIGIGLSGASYNIVLAAFGKLLPEDRRSMATGIGGAAGSFGQFLFSPLCVLLLNISDWRTTLLVFGAMLLLVLPLSLPLTTSAQIREARESAAPSLAMQQVFLEAFRQPTYVLLVAGYLVSGFHVAFINMHLPAHLQDGGLDRPSAGWVIATIGLFNIVGSVAVGWLCGRYRNRSVLFSVYCLRALVIASFMLLPLTPFNALLFAAAMGLLWISSVTPVAGLIAGTFGTQNLAALYGLAFFFHQIGAFFGVWVGGLAFERTGSYNGVWWFLVAAALGAGVLTLLIREPSAPPRQ